MTVMGDKQSVLKPGATLAEAEAELADLRRQEDERRKVAAKEAAERAKIDATIEKEMPARTKALIAGYRKLILEDGPAIAAATLARAQLEFELRGGTWDQPPAALEPGYVARTNQW